MTLLKDYIKSDDITDEEGDLLRKMSKIFTWTKEKNELFGMFASLAKKKKYGFFTGNLRTYGISRKGQHYLFDVPMNQRGALSNFRGKRVRLVCVGDGAGRGARQYCVKALHTPSMKKNGRSSPAC